MKVKLVVISFLSISIVLMGWSIYAYITASRIDSIENRKIVLTVNRLIKDLKILNLQGKSLDERSEEFSRIKHRIRKLRPSLDQLMRTISGTKGSLSCGDLPACKLVWPKNEAVEKVAQALEEVRRISADLRSLDKEISSLQMGHIDLNRRITDIENRTIVALKNTSRSTGGFNLNVVVSSIGSLVSVFVAIFTMFVAWNKETRDKLRFSEELENLRLTNKGLNLSLRKDSVTKQG